MGVGVEAWKRPDGDALYHCSIYFFVLEAKQKPWQIRKPMHILQMLSSSYSLTRFSRQMLDKKGSRYRSA